ncbi:MAG: alpha/beta hydrolase domain-containing protein [Vicinamibacterales bacterium]
MPIRSYGTLAAVLLTAALAEARVVRLDIQQTRPFAAGASWGTAGPYERLDGVAHFEVDPRDPLNAVIVNIDKAPRNARGMVEFSSPFYILRPTSPAKSNRKLFFGINNRGGQVELMGRSAPGVSAGVYVDPIDAAAVGDGFLLRQGYLYVDAGWHGDQAPAPGRLFASLPVAKQPDGSAIVQMSRVELQVNSATFSQALVGGFRPEPAADLSTSRSTLTVRANARAARTPVAPDRWAFGRCPKGRESLTASPTDVCLFEGFTPGQIYELIYPAKDPVVMGLGLVVTRDLASFLRYQTKDDAGNANPLALTATDVGLRHAYGSGSSSTGMYLREWLYLGMNEDESHRKVFDAVLINTAGAHRLFSNVAFTHPTFYSGQDQHQDYVSNAVAPFTFAVTTDPVTGITDGILKRPATDPFVIQIDGDFEFWSWKSSLNVVDGRGTPVAQHPKVRLYLQTSSGHGSGLTGLLTTPSSTAPNCQNPQHGAGGNVALTRALTVAMDAWVDKGTEPPRSNFPTLADGGLVTVEEYLRAFPRIPGAAMPGGINELSALDFGPLFGPVGGIQTTLPPNTGGAYRLWVPKADADGNSVPGVRTIHVRVPLGTNVGWNVRPGARAPEMCGLAGSYFPFAATKQERLASGDPRRSLEERYGDRNGFVAAVTRATRDLVRERFLLPGDADRYIKAAGETEAFRGVPPAR